MSTVPTDHEQPEPIIEPTGTFKTEEAERAAWVLLNCSISVREGNYYDAVIAIDDLAQAIDTLRQRPGDREKLAAFAAHAIGKAPKDNPKEQQDG